MWNGNLHVMGQSTLDIVPALRTVAVSVKNKALNNLIDHLGFYNLTAWTDPRSFISKKNETTYLSAAMTTIKGWRSRHKAFP